MNNYDQSKAAYPPPATAYPVEPHVGYMPPPSAGYPMKDGPPDHGHAPAATTRSKGGGGFWRGCCAALCCCCVLDACF